MGQLLGVKLGRPSPAGDENNGLPCAGLFIIEFRFGAVNEIGVFAMVETGLKEVKNPSLFIIFGTNRNNESL